jgi:hypothetical protein
MPLEGKSGTVRIFDFILSNLKYFSILGCKMFVI